MPSLAPRPYRRLRHFRSGACSSRKSASHSPNPRRSPPMKTTMPAPPVGRRALVLVLLPTAFLAATLSFGAHPASAAYTAKVQTGTLKVTGDEASDKLVLRIQGGSPA